jgi:hypothetical protein
MPPGLTGEMHREEVVFEGDRADRAVDPIRKAVVGQRHVAAAQRHVGRYRAGMPDEMGPHVDLARGKQLAPVRRHRLGKQAFPVVAHEHAFRLHGDVVVGCGVPLRAIEGQGGKRRRLGKGPPVDRGHARARILPQFSYRKGKGG